MRTETSPNHHRDRPIPELHLHGIIAAMGVTVEMATVDKPQLPPVQPQPGVRLPKLPKGVIR